MIKCEAELILTRSKKCVLVDMATRDAEGDNPAIVTPSGATFKIIDTKLYVSVVTLSTENDKKLLEKLKSGFKRTVKWNKYRSQMNIQSNNNNSNYLSDPIFAKVSRLFVLSFERIEESNVNKDHRDSFSPYYVLNVEIKDFNVFIDGKSFFEKSKNFL